MKGNIEKTYALNSNLVLWSQKTYTYRAVPPGICEESGELSGLHCRFLMLRKPEKDF